MHSPCTAVPRHRSLRIAELIGPASGQPEQRSQTGPKPPISFPSTAWIAIGAGGGADGLAAIVRVHIPIPPCPQEHSYASPPRPQPCPQAIVSSVDAALTAPSAAS